MPPFIDFLVPPLEIGGALLIGLLFPLLLLATRYVAAISANPSRRYLTACAFAVLLWLLPVLFLEGGTWSANRGRHFVNGLLVLTSSFIFFLGLWGLLTRGCSISILIALSRLDETATESTLAAGYSGDRGLLWLTEKRVRSLIRAGFATHQLGIVRVTKPLGVFAARIFKMLISIIGLKSFG